MENFKPQNFQSQKAEDFLQEAIAAEKAKKEDENNSKEGEDDDVKNQPERGEEIETVSAADEGEDVVKPVEFEPGGNITEEEAKEFERTAKFQKAGGDPEQFSAEGDVTEMIKDGENIQQELLENKKQMEDQGETVGQDYRNIVDKLDYIEHKLKELRETQQGEAMEAFIERQESEQEPKDDLDEQGEAMKAYLQREGAWDDKDKKQISKIEVKEEENSDNQSTSEASEPEPIENLDTPEAAPDANAETTEPTAEELYDNAQQSYEEYLEAQKRFSRAKGKLGMLGKVRQKLGLVSDDKKEELNQLSEEVDSAKKGLQEAELKFQQEHKIYANHLVEQKRQELIAEDQAKCREANWDEERLAKRLSSYKKTPHFKEALRLFVISDPAVDFKTKKTGVDGQIEEGIEKLSLLEDMNKKLMAVNEARMQALNESERNILQKSWDWYKKQPRKTKIMLGAAFAVPLSAGAALAGGATTGVAMGAAAFGGGRKIVSSIASMAAGGFTYKKTREWLSRKQYGKEKKKEIKMSKEISKGEELDLYRFMKDRLAQEKKDNYKSLAAAGVVGLAIGGSLRLTDVDVLEPQELPDNAKSGAPEVSDAADKATEGESLDDVGEGQIGIEQTEGMDPMTKDIYGDWNEIISGKGDIPPEFADLAVFDSFRDFVEEKYGNFNPHSREIVQQWNEYSELVPEEAKTSKAFEYFDREFKQFENADNARIAGREFDGITRLLNGTEREYEMRIQGAEYAEKMNIDFDPFSKNVTGKFEGHVLTEINGHKIPLDLLSEEDKIKVLNAREMAQQMSGQGMSAKDIPDIKEGDLEDRILRGEPYDKSDIEQSEVVTQKLSASEYIKGVEDMKKAGRMPNLLQMRDYKHALMAEKNGVEDLFQPKGKLPEDVTEKILESREAEPAGEAQKSSGAGEEFGAGYDPELYDDKAAETNTEGRVETTGEIKDFSFELAKDDVLWAKLEEHMNGDELKMAEKLNDFRIESAKKMILDHGFSPEDAQKYVHWRFQNLQPGDSISFTDGELSIANFVDKGNVDFFMNEFDVSTAEDSIEFVSTEGADSINTDNLDVAQDEEVLVAENGPGGKLEEHLSAIQKKNFEKIEAKEMLAAADEPSGSTAINSAENVGRRILRSVENEIGLPKKGESVLAYLDKYPKGLSAQQLRGIDSIIKAA